MLRLVRPPGSSSSLCSVCWRKLQRRQLATAAGSQVKLHPSYSPVAHDTAPGAQHEDRTLRDIFDNPDVWRSFSTKLYNPSLSRTGLFQNRDLTSPDGFKTYANRTLRKAQRLVASMENARTPDQLVRVPRDLDRLSDFLCRVIDMCDFVRSTHPERAIVAAAHDAYSTMYEYMNILNTTTGLHAALKRAMDNPQVVARLSAEERTVATILMQDFEKSGINLPHAARQRFVQLSNDIARLGQAFVTGMRPQKAYLQFDSSRLRGMDPMVVRELTRRGTVTLPPYGMPANHALSTVEDEAVRREVYLASRSSHQTQIDVLETMLRRRAELAKLVGRQSYAEVALGDKMAKSPESVIKFLTALSTANKPAAKAEVDLLQSVKNEFGQLGSLKPWDKDFYAAKYIHNLRNRSKHADTLSSFFSLGTVMQGLSRVFNSLYGIRFVPREPSPGETWNPDVRRLDVISETEGHIAVVYCDLFERPGKNPNPAHFTIRCSRRIDEDECTEDAMSGDLPDDGMASARRPSDNNALYQLPTIALICDFSSGHSGTTLLSFQEVQTLFHEMGHAVHSMLGRTALHNVAGTRCSTDWAELPSVLMEHFARDPRVLSLFAQHYETGEALPQQLLQHRLHRQSLFEAGETRHQIILALLDQYYHSSLPENFSSTKVFRDIENKYSLFQQDETTSWQGFFTHLYGYGATYYAYLFDRAIAARIWTDVFAAAPLERERGEKFKTEVLQWGGARSGWRCLAGVLGRPELENGGDSAMVEVGRWGSELK